MISTFRKAYGGGYRAGFALQPLIVHPDGSKTVAQAPCPYAGRWQFIQRWLWEAGWYEGMMKKLNKPLGRKDHGGDAEQVMDKVRSEG